MTTTYLASDLEDDRIFESDVWCHHHIASKLLDHEPWLFGCKWFDYRPLTLLEALERYAQDYGIAYRRVYARRFDRNRAEHMPVPQVRAITQELSATTNSRRSTALKTMLTGLWRGRQMADGLTMPYDLFVELSLEERLRNWQRAYMPKPHQLYTDWNLEKIQARWEALQVETVHLASHPLYSAENWHNLPDQRLYHEWLIAQIGRRRDPIGYASRLLQAQALPETKLRAALTDAQWDVLQTIV